MKLWLSKNSEVPMREQLITQITLGISSGDLDIGQKLPSRGEISRRFGIHVNTVSNAYQKLTEQGLIEFKQGSGFFVCESKADNLENKNELDILTAGFLNNAQTLGFSFEEIQESFLKHLENKSAKEFLVVESNESLRQILISEIKDKVSTKVLGISFEEFRSDFENWDATFVALIDEEEKIESVLPSDKICIYLKSGSIPQAMQGESRPSEDSLIAVVSGWEDFLQMSKTILVAAKVDADSIVIRSTQKENWQRGLENAALIICDSLIYKDFVNDERVRPFQLISDNSIKELKSYLD